MKSRHINKLIFLLIGILALLCISTVVSAEWTTRDILVYPEVEGYVIYNSATGTYTKYTSWDGDYEYFPMFYNSSTNQFTRLFFEWNFSHYMPLSTMVTKLNLSYWSFYLSASSNQITIVSFNGSYSIPGRTHVNDTSAQLIYENISNERAYGEYKNWDGYFAGSPDNPPATIMNISTCEGDWSNLAGRNITERLQENISLSSDFMVLGYFATGAGASTGMIGTLKNTTAPCRPFLWLNVTYNISESNSTTFTNGTYFPRTSVPNITFNISNLNGTPTTFSVMCYDVTSGMWYEEQFNRSQANGTQTIQLDETSFIGFGTREYYVYIDIIGNFTDRPIYNFTVEGTPPEPPTDLKGHDYNSTTLNISFTPHSVPYATTHTVCYYQEGTSAPTYGAGTLAGNVSGNNTIGWINVTGLTKGTTYTFAFWTYLNTTLFAGISENFTYITNTTGYGEIIVTLRHENMSEDGTNHIINLTHFGNSSHRLLIHYTNLSEQPVFFDGWTYNASGYFSNQSVTLKYAPLFYELTWNYTVNGTVMEGTYTRILTPYAEETITGDTYLTFYLQTDEHVYNQYYLLNGTWTLEEDIDGRLVEYSYIFDDKAGYFSTVTSYDVYSTVYFYNNTKQIIVEQRFLDATRKTAPVLVYKRQYFIGIASVSHDEVNIYYDNLGLAPTERYTSPYQETIVINPYTTTYLEMMNGTSFSHGWLTNGFWFKASNTNNQITHMVFSVYNSSNGTLLYIKWVNSTSDYNFTYTTTDPNHNNLTYNATLNYTYEYESGKIDYVSTGSIPIYKSLNYLTLAANIEATLTAIFGLAPFYNPTTMTYISYVDTIAIIISFLLLAFFAGTGHPTIAIASPGLLLLFFGTAISGVNTFGYLLVGFFLLVLSILYALHIGGYRQ